MKIPFAPVILPLMADQPPELLNQPQECGEPRPDICP